MNNSCDFHYVCYRCTVLMPAYFSELYSDKIKMLKEKTNSTTYIFYCEECFQLLNNIKN